VSKIIINRSNKKIIDIISLIISFLVFAFLIKYCYFDTKIGFDTSILDLNYSSFPIWLDILISIFILPMLVFSILQENLEKLIKFLNNKNTNYVFV